MEVFDDMPLHVCNKQKQGVLSMLNSRFVCEVVFANQSIIVELEFVFLELLFKHRRGLVRRVEDQLYGLDISTTKGITNVNSELHFSLVWAVRR